MAVDSVSFRRESYAEVRHEIGPLLDRHWQDIALNQDRIKLNPDWAKYQTLDGIGALRVFTARSRGRLVGYCVLIVMPGLHYASHTFATNDVLFTHPDHRKGSMGVRFLRFVERELKAEGVDVIVMNMKLHAPFDGVLRRLGFTPIETIFSKYIGNT